MPTIHLGPTSTDTTKLVEPVSAASPFSFASVLGRSIPIVVGTGKVEGIPVIGGAKTVTKVSGYQTVHIGWGAQGGYPAGTQFKGTGFAGYDALIPNSSTEQVAAIGYLLAYDPFGDGYELIRLEINDVVVYNAEKGIGASTTFRFYGGNHTAVDPIASGVIGAKAGAWQHYAMVYIDGYATTNPPKVRAVLSNAADVDAAASVPIAGSYSATDWGDTNACYDVTTGTLYQWSVLGGQDVLYVLNVDDRAELFYVPWPTSLPDPISFVALPGSGYVMVSSYGDASPYPVGLVNSMTGAVVASTVPSGSKTWEAIAWFEALDAGAAGMGTTFLVLGQYLTVQTSPTDDANAVIAVCNTAAGTIELIDLSITYDGWGFACRGRVTPTSASFFVVNWSYYGAGEFANVTISEIIWDGTSVSTSDVYTIPAGYALGVAYDPMTGYLVIPANASGVHSIYIVDPQTGALIKTISTAHNFDLANYYGYQISNRFFPSFGSVFLIERTELAVYILNLSTFGITKYADWYPTAPYPDGNYPEFGIYDQSRNSWLEAYNADPIHWSIHRAALATPRAVPLNDIITKLMFLANYGPSDLTFDSFTGIAA